MKNEERVKYWIDSAIYDFQSAKVMLDGKRYLYVGFLCHQTIEKIFKACYSDISDEIPPYTHQLLKLARLTGLYDQLSEEFKDTLDILDPLNIETRYPSHKEELLKSLTDERCKNILKRTEELYLWIMKKL